METARLMTIVNYAEKHKVTRQTIYNWIKEGKLKTIKLGSQQFIKV